MKQIGYAILKNTTTLMGTSGLPLVHTKISRDRYASDHPNDDFQVVPLFVGEPITHIVPPETPAIPTPDEPA